MLLPSPSHSLGTVRRKATVTALVPGPPPKVRIQLGGDDGTSVAAGDTQDVPYLDSYFPAVGDDVATASVDGDHLVLGRTADNSTPYLSIGWAGHTINNVSNQVSFATTDPLGWWDATNNLYTLPYPGLYIVDVLYRYNAAHAAAGCELRLNGANYQWGGNDNGAQFAGPQLHGVFPFAAGDTLAVRASVTGIGDTAGNFFTIARIGRT